MKSTITVPLRCALGISAAMLAAELVARVLGSSFSLSMVAAGAIMLTGYMGGALYLLRHRKHLGRWVHVRLLVSLLTPAAVGVIALAQPFDTVALGLVMLFSTMAAFPLLWLGVYDVSRGLQGLQPGTWRFDEELNPGILPSMGWSLLMAFLVLVVSAPFINLGWTALAMLGLLVLNGSAEVAILGWAIVHFTIGAVEEMGSTVVSGQMLSSSSSADEDWVWEDSRRIDDDDHTSIFPEVTRYNPTSGLEMVGAFDIGGYGYGESQSDHSPWDHSSIDSFTSHDTSISGSSWHDS